MTHPDFRPEAFLVDLDGVLVHSHDAHVTAYEEAFRDHDLALEPGVHDLIRRGVARPDVLARSGAPDHLHPSLSRAKEEAFEGAVREGGVETAPGAREFLVSLESLGCPVAVVSNSATARAAMETLGLDGLVRFVVDAGGVSLPKPDPEGFLKAATEMGVAPERCVAVEDSRPGAAAARAAGMFVVGVGPGVDAPDVDVLVEELAAIPLEEWLRAQGSS